MALFQGLQDNVAVPFEVHTVEAGDGPEMETKLNALFASLPNTSDISDFNVAGDGVGHRWICTVTTMEAGQQTAPAASGEADSVAAAAVVAGNAAELQFLTAARLLALGAEDVLKFALGSAGVGPAYMQIALIEP